VSQEVIWLLLFTPSGEIIRNLQVLRKDFSGTWRASLHRQPFSEGGAAMAKRTRITIETDSLLILRSRSSRRAWCPRCLAEADMIALDEVGVISNLERPALEEWLNSEELHRSRATDGSTLICLNSLLARVQKT
jgi:hypothetical protein